MSYVAKGKYFVLCYVSDYEPPDEDGFGAKWEYKAQKCMTEEEKLPFTEYGPDETTDWYWR